MTWQLASIFTAVSWKRSLRCLPSGLVVSCVVLLGITFNNAAAEDQRISRGQALFQKEWTFEPPAIIKQNEGESPDQFVERLGELPGDGLGPMHNATSCEACHVGGGAAGVKRNVMMLTLDPRAPFIKNNDTGKAARNALLGLYPGLLSPTGVVTMDVVVHEKSTRPFFDSIRNQLADFVPSGIADEWFDSEQRTVDAIANQPVIAGRYGELDFYLSQRNSPPLFGLGLIDQIGQDQLMMLARAQPRRSKGKVTGRVGAGKFGWRAQTFSLEQFVRGACAGELGLQVTGSPQSADIADDSYLSVGFDMTDGEVRHLTSFVRSLPQPMQETLLPEQRVDIRDGERLFAKIGCNVCHVETVYPAREIYSDLLLHDMGDLLQAPSPAPPGAVLASVPRKPLPSFPMEPGPTPASSLRRLSFLSQGYYGINGGSTPVPYEFERPETPKFPRGSLPPRLSATPAPERMTWDFLQREWRTPPLWGVADSGPYLHDGRADTLDAAIRWHGGEAAESAKNYRSLTAADRETVIAFLSSLRAPPMELRATKDNSVRPEDSTVRSEEGAKTPLADVAEASLEPGGLQEVISVFQQGY